MVKKMFIPNYKKLVSSANPNNLIVLSTLSLERAIIHKEFRVPSDLGTNFKPRGGFWYSHPDADLSWSEWNFLEGAAKIREPATKHLYEIKRPVLHSYRIDTIDKLIDFTLKFGIIDGRTIYDIDWNKVALEYGIIDLDAFRLGRMSNTVGHEIPKDHPKWQAFKDKDKNKTERPWPNYYIYWHRTWDIDGGVIIQDFDVEIVKVLYAPRKEILELIEQNHDLSDKIVRVLDLDYLPNEMDPTTAGTERYRSEWKEQLRRKKNADSR